MKRALLLCVLTFAMVAAGLSQTTDEGTLNAANCSGSDIGAKINACYALLPAAGGRIVVPKGEYNFTTPIAFNTVDKVAFLECDPGSTTLNFTPTSGVAINFNWGANKFGGGMRGCIVKGPWTSSNTTPTTQGISRNCSNGGTQQLQLSFNRISGFSKGIDYSASVTTSGFLDVIMGNDFSSNHYALNFSTMTENTRLIGNTFHGNDVDIEMNGDGATAIYLFSNSFDGVNGAGPSIDLRLGQIDNYAPWFENVNLGSAYFVSNSGGVYSQYGGSMQEDNGNAAHGSGSGATSYFVNCGDWTTCLFSGAAWRGGGDNWHIAQAVNATANAVVYVERNTIVSSSIAAVITPTYVGALRSEHGTSQSDGAVKGAEILSAAGWTNAGWTGNYASGFTHSTGNTSPLSYAFTATSGQPYRVAFTVAGRSAGSVSVTVGGAAGINSGSAVYNANGAFVTGPIAAGAGGLVVTPTSDFNGSISALSVVPLSASAPIYKFTDSVNYNVVDFRAPHNSLSSVFVGLNAGKFLSSGVGNTGVGVNAMPNTTSGESNSAFGMNALYGNSVGGNNTAVGLNALYGNTTGSRNTGVGFGAGVANWTQNATGSDNTWLGWNAGPNADGYSNSICIGSGCTNTASNQVDIGNASTLLFKLRGAVELVNSGASGKALCKKSDNTVGSCQTAVDASGSCTCN